MSRVHEIVARLKAEGASDYTGEVEEAAEATEQLGDTSEDAAERSEGAWGRLNDSIGAISAGLGAAGAVFEGFARKSQAPNEQLGRLEVLTGGARGELRELVSDLTHADPTFSPDDALAGMDALQRRGVDTAEQFEELLPRFDAFADATGKSIDEGISQAERVLSATGTALEDITDQHIDTLTYLNTQTNVRMGTFERNIGRVADELQDLDLDLMDAAAGVEVFTDRGYDGQEAVREFRRAVEGSEGDMGTFLDNIGLTADEFDEYQGKVADATGVTSDLAGAHAEAYTPMQRLQSRVEDLMFEYGGLADAAGMLSPIMMGGAATMYTVTKAVTLLRRQTLLTTAAKYGLATAKGAWTVAAGIATVGSYALGAGIRFMLGPIGLVITAVGLLVAGGIALYRNWDTVKEKLGAAWDWISDKASSVFGAITSTIRGAVNSVIGAVNSMIDAFNGVSIRLPTIPDWVPIVGGKGGESISLPNIPRIPQLGAREASQRVYGRNAGGPIPGRGPNRDSVLIHGTPGEWVLNRDASDALGPDTLAILNRLDRADHPLAGAVRRAVTGPDETHEIGQGGGGGRGPQTWRTLAGIMGASGVPHRVTSTVRNWGGTSFHETGHAIDLAGPSPSSRPTPAMGRIFDFWAQHAGGLAELIYAGRSRNVKNGRWVSPYAVAQHRDHVHVAATAGGLEGAAYADPGDGSGIPRWARPVLNAIARGFGRAFGVPDAEWGDGAYVDRPWSGMARVAENEAEFVTPESQLARVIDERLAAAGGDQPVHLQVDVHGDVLDPEQWFRKNRRAMAEAVAQEVADVRAGR